MYINERKRESARKIQDKEQLILSESDKKKVKKVGIVWPES